MPQGRRIESVFLNVPYDNFFEDLYLAYIVGLTQLGIRINVSLAIPNSRRLNTIIQLIEGSDSSIHDLSRIEMYSGVPRFNMPLELGLALYRAHMTNNQHSVFIFEGKRYRTQRSTSDINGIDPQIHRGTPQGVMGGLRNIFRQPEDATTVPEMLASFRNVKRKLPQLRRNSGSKFLFEAAIFADLVLAALVESQNLIARRSRRSATARP